MPGQHMADPGRGKPPVGLDIVDAGDAEQHRHAALGQRMGQLDAKRAVVGGGHGGLVAGKGWRERDRERGQ